MAERLKNIAGLFKESRTRVIILTTLAILLIAIAVGYFSIRGRMAGEGASAGVTQAPGGIGSVPFAAPNEEYARLQEKQNKQQAKAAEESGQSAIPTIVRSTNAPVNVPADAQTGVGFTALSREQSDAGTFNPKVFTGGDNKNAAQPVKCEVTAGTPVYDDKGNLIGYVGADGKVRDLNGKVIGSVDPDGTVRDASGKIIGKVSPAGSSLGTPVYDKNGRLIGYAGADGKVRDAAGNIIGSVGADGQVRDANGNVVGQVASALSGTPVYDDKGNLIGYVGADGKVRDATGRIIGVVGPDGLVRDVTGKVLGHVGTPVYDENGKLLGFAGPDGKVRDANGNIIGTVGPDGVVRDASGKIIGKAGAIPPGSPIYDKNGNILGTVGPDGKVRDANGNIIGTLGTDGLVRDANGNVIGSAHRASQAALDIKPPPETAVTKSADINAPAQSGTGAVAATPEQNAAAIEARQQAVLNDQQLQQQIQQKQQAMSSQANQLLVAWGSPNQQLVTGTAVADQSGSGGSGESNAAASGGKGGNTAAGPVFIKAGTVYYGTINTSINSDQPGPVMASIISGPYTGGKLLGTLTNQGQAVMLTFNILTLPAFSRSIKINAVAIDQNTARTALSTYTDNHYLLRYGTLFAAAFVQGYGQAFSQAGSTTSSTGLTVQTTSPDLGGAGKFYVALGNVGTQLSGQMNSIFNTPPTVYVASGTSVAVLFLDDVQMPSA